MPGGLNPVLITNTETIIREIDSADRVQVEDVAKLWKVYSINSTHVRHDEAARMENFFWRIWGNRTIMTSIRGTTLARLFLTISEGGNLVRARPVPTPLATTSTQNVTFSIPPAAPANHSHVSPDRGAQLLASSSTIDSGTSPRPTSDPSHVHPPILKKGRTGSQQQPGSAKILCADFVEARDPAIKTVRRESSESAGAVSPLSGPAGKGLRSAGKKRTSFAAAAGTRKARPGAMRKRSSQSSASGEQRKGSQTSPLPGAQPGKITPKSATGLPTALTTASFALSTGSWQDVDSTSLSRNSPEDTFVASQQPSSWLVDKDFRGKFVENQKRNASSINLAALGRSQSVRFLDELPEHQRPAGDGKTGPLEGDPESSGSGGRAQLSAPWTLSSAIEGEESGNHDATWALPRTKSQLSMLIDKERKYSGSTNLGP